MDNQSFPIVGYVRQVRRYTRTSQRELAEYLGIPQSTIARIETGRRAPTVATFTRILRFAGLSLVVVDEEGRFCPPLEELDDTRDWGERRWPAHLGLILDPRPGEWWGDRYGLIRPPETARRDPAARRRHREVFHRMRGIATTGEIKDWQQRHADDARGLAARQYQSRRPVRRQTAERTPRCQEPEAPAPQGPKPASRRRKRR